LYWNGIKVNWKIEQAPKIQMLIKTLKKSSWKAAGFFSQKTKA